jgi:hypothetical protein
MMSVRLGLIFDDVGLGISLTRLAALYFQAGDINQGIQTRADAEACYTSADGSSARLCLDEQEMAARSIKILRSAIDHLSTTKCCKQSDLTAEDLEHAIFQRA